MVATRLEHHCHLLGPKNVKIKYSVNSQQVQNRATKEVRYRLLNIKYFFHFDNEHPIFLSQIIFKVEF